MTFTRRWEDVDGWHYNYKVLQVYNNEQCFFDLGAAANNARMMRTSDGINWTQLYSALGATYGNFGGYDGCDMAVYNDSLFVTRYRVDTVNPKVLEWNGINLVSHLPNPQGGGVDNYLAIALEPWARRLWCLTCITAGALGRRVVYYYDGTDWTAITNYDGAAYLDYNRLANLPTDRIKHRCSRLFVFNDELYILATRWTGAKWAWEVWKFDAENFDRFNMIFDSDVFDDGYALSAVVKHEGLCKVVGNTLAAAGGPQNAGKLYASEDMENWIEGDSFASLGWPYGEVVHDGKFYLNCLDVATNNTQIRSWNGRLSDFTLEQQIITHSSIHGGGLGTFNGDIYAGKYREIYAESGTLRKQLRRKGRSLWLLKLIWKNKKGEELEELVAPIDTRADTRFWEGRIKNMSSFTRAMDDRTGLFKIADLSLTLANNDKRYSKRLARYMLKNQLAQLYHCWADEPEAWRRHIITLIVDDHSLSGTHFDVKLKDITQRYFAAKIPESICTEEDYPNIHPDHIGRYMPEVLGNVSMTTGEKRGAVEAVYVNTAGPPYQYLVSRGQLDGIDTVYADNVALGGGDWAFVPGPPSLINITPDQVNKTITYDGRGYSYGIWDDPIDGYVRNPAYIVAYFLRVLMALPASLVNMISFDAMANYFITIGEQQSGRLILQKSAKTMELFRQLLFSYGMKGFIALDGRLVIDKKDIYNWEITSLDAHVFTQIELLAPGTRQYNLPNAINTVKARYNYIPWARLFLGAGDAYMDNFYPGGPMEDDIKHPEEPLPV